MDDEAEHNRKARLAAARGIGLRTEIVSLLQSGGPQTAADVLPQLTTEHVSLSEVAFQLDRLTEKGRPMAKQETPTVRGRGLAVLLASLLVAAAVAACGGGGDQGTGGDTLRSVRAQIAKAREEEAVCAEMIETERTNIEVAKELGRPTHNFELLLTTNEKCLEREQLREVNLREREGELEAGASGE